MARKASDIAGIVSDVLIARARQRQIPLGRRKITVLKFRNPIRVNRHEIFISIDYALVGNPFDMVDPIIDLVLDFDTRVWQERAKQITMTKCTVMNHVSYLERHLSPINFARFIDSLHTDGVKDIEYYAPD